MGKISHHVDAFSGIFELKASPVEGQQLLQKVTGKTRGKGKRERGRKKKQKVDRLG